MRHPRGARYRSPWNRAELANLGRLTDPGRIQAFIDRLPYSADPFSRSPRSVLRDRKANCFDGALFAAAALRHVGYPPLVVDMRAVRDDDHVIAVYRRGGHIGAVAQSNCVGLRYREPVFRTVRELVLSYFEDYFNVEHEKTLRSYSAPFNLSRLDGLCWETSDEHLEEIGARLDAMRHFPLLSARQVASLARVDKRSYVAGFIGSNWAGLYKPKR